MSVGTSEIVYIKFMGDNVQKMGGSIKGQSLCDAGWGDTDWSAGTTSLMITGKKEGTATFTVDLMNKDETIIYSKSFTVTFVNPT